MYELFNYFAAKQFDEMRSLFKKTYLELIPNQSYHTLHTLTVFSWVKFWKIFILCVLTLLTCVRRELNDLFAKIRIEKKYFHLLCFSIYFYFVFFLSILFIFHFLFFCVYKSSNSSRYQSVFKRKMVWYIDLKLEILNTNNEFFFCTFLQNDRPTPTMKNINHKFNKFFFYA